MDVAHTTGPARRGVVVLLLLVLAGCGVGSRGAAARTAPGPSVAPSASATPAPAEVAPVDLRACNGVEAVISHLRVDTAHWTPRAAPFDRAMSRRIAVQAHDLDLQATQAVTASVRQAIHLSAASFLSLTRAMARHRRTDVDVALVATQGAYRVLKKQCALGS